MKKISSPIQANALSVATSTIQSEQKVLRHRSEEVLRMLVKAVETMQIGVTITDTEGRILYTNPAEASMHGYDVSELVGKDVRIFSPATLWRPMALKQIKTMKRWKRE